MKVSLTSELVGVPVKKATLSLYVTNNDWGDTKFFIGRVTQAWNITDKWNITIAQTKDDPPTLPVTIATPWVDTVLTIGTNNFGWINFDVTGAVAYFIQNPTKNYGFLVHGTTAASFWSSDYTVDITKRPKITVEYETSATSVVSQTRQDVASAVSMKNGRLRCSFSDDAAHMLHVFAPNGRSVVHTSIQGNAAVDLSGYGSGCYMVKIDNQSVVVNSGM